MRTESEAKLALKRRQGTVHALHAAIFCVAALLTAASAIVVKEAGPVAPLARVDRVEHNTQAPIVPVKFQRSFVETSPVNFETDERGRPTDARWFNGRMVVPVRTIWMTVTAYSPDHRSCYPYADGQTATLHSVWTNGMRLVAADTKVLPFGSMISVPGYYDGEVVPVLDRGGAIKGNRLDVLYATHSIARQWGVQRLPITVWGYADGSPIDNPRKLR